MWMWYHTVIKDTVLFEGWKVESVEALIFTCFLVVLAGILHESIKYSKKSLGRKSPVSTSQYGGLLIAGRESSHLHRTVLHFLQLLIGYCLMNVYMTFSIWICLSICFGLAVGNWIFFSRNVQQTDD